MIAWLSVLLLLIAAPQSDSERKQFEKSFEAARGIGAWDEMQKLVKRRPGVAARFAVDNADFASRAQGKYRERLDAFQRVWTKAFPSSGDLVATLDAYFGGLDDAARRARAVALSEWKGLTREHGGMRAGAEDSAWDALARRYAKNAAELDRVGERWFASQSWLGAAVCDDETSRGKSARLDRAREAYEKCLAAREALGVDDRKAAEVRLRLKSLQVRAEKAGESAGALETKGSLLRASTSFEFVEPDFLKRPNFYLDGIRELWSRAYLEGGVGSSGQFRGLGELSPHILRIAPTDVRVDTDGDGKGEGEPRIPMTSKLVPLEFEIGEGGGRRQWGCQVTIGSGLESYNGVSINLAPTEEQLFLFYQPCASVVTELAGVPLRLIDENGDGLYGSRVEALPSEGTCGAPEPRIDSVVVGKEKRARPWSSVQKLGKQWYKIEAKQGGRQLEAQALEIETGKLSLKTNKVKPTWLLIEGLGALSGATFDLRSGRTSELPAGRYRLCIGELRQGKGARVAKCLILPGPEMQEIVVEPGTSTALTLGAPFRFAYEAEDQGEAVQVRGQSVCVVGSAGERYLRLWNAVPRPTVALRPAGSRKARIEERMTPVLDRDQMSAHSPKDSPFLAAWFPLDLTLDKKKSEQVVELSLSQSKHPLFGSIESDWTPVR